MERVSQIRDALKKLAAQHGPDNSMLAQVKSVNEGELTCDLYDEESELIFYDVRLMPVLNGKQSMTLIPKVDSWVVAIRVEDSEDWVIVGVNEIDKWRLMVGQSIIEQDTTGLLIKKQSDTLLDALKLIVEAVQKIVVIQGQNPDQVKLQQALVKLQNILR
jgi:hypothetical protein